MIIHYKCPNCGSEMVYDADSGKLHCNSCGREDSIEDFPESNINREFSDTDGKEYNCQNCGAVLLTDDDTTATTCSFCNSPMVIGDRLTGEMAPSKIIPFKIDKEKAQMAFKNWAGNGKLTPNGFMTADRIKNISGMYIPFWLYDLNSKVEIRGKGTVMRSYTRGEYNYTETSYYDVYRNLDLNYLKVPVDASLKMNDILMDSVEPYDYEKLTEFKTPYLAGYLAEKYNYTEDELLPRVKGKIENYIESYIQGTLGQYNTVNFSQKDIKIANTDAYYTLLPIWMVYYDYKGKEYIFAMNGQTGKVVGRPPISKGKVVLWFSSMSLSIFIMLKILIILFMGGGLW